MIRTTLRRVVVDVENAGVGDVVADVPAPREDELHGGRGDSPVLRFELEPS